MSLFNITFGIWFWFWFSVSVLFLFSFCFCFWYSDSIYFHFSIVFSMSFSIISFSFPSAAVLIITPIFLSFILSFIIFINLSFSSCFSIFCDTVIKLFSGRSTTNLPVTWICDVTLAPFVLTLSFFTCTNIESPVFI